MREVTEVSEESFLKRSTGPLSLTEVTGAIWSNPPPEDRLPH